MDYKERLEKEEECRRGLIASFPYQKFTEESGIYIFTRYDPETELKFAYVGQAVNMLRRLIQHCMCDDRSHIDKSLIKRKFYTPQNPYGWKLVTVYCPAERMNEIERATIRNYGNGGYQLYNKTSGGQDGGKVGIAPNAPSKGYRDGLKQGYENARKEIAALFEKYLTAQKSSESKYAEKALEKFKNFIKL